MILNPAVTPRSSVRAERSQRKRWDDFGGNVVEDGFLSVCRRVLLRNRCYVAQGPENIRVQHLVLHVVEAVLRIGRVAVVPRLRLQR